MRPIVFVLALVVPTPAAAQQPLAVEQADDAETPPTTPPPTTPPTLSPRATMLLPPPQGWTYRVTEAPPTREHRWGLFTAGIVTLSVAWVANLQAGIPTGEWFLDVPLIGPLMEIARINDAGGSDPLVGWLDFMLVTDALVQMGGLALTIAGAHTYRDKPGLQRIELVPCAAGAAIRGSF